MPNNLIKGFPGFTYSTIILTVNPAQYLGDGINGWNGGTDYEFNVRERDLEQLRPRQTTIDGPYDEGVGGPLGMRVQLSGYFKGPLLPQFPPLGAMQGEYIFVTAQVGFTFEGVVLVESFKQSGVIDNALQWTLQGTTDGTFSTGAIT